MMPLRELLGAGVALHFEESADFLVDSRIEKKMQGVSRQEIEAAVELVLAARPALEDAQAARDAVVDGVVQADVEVEEVVLLDAAPVAAEQAISVLHVE